MWTPHRTDGELLHFDEPTATTGLSNSATNSAWTPVVSHRW